MTPDLSRAAWRKSSRSAGNGGECVELAYLGALRDSKNPTGATLRVDLDLFLTEIKTGRFDQA
ncbi:MAG TPA: DUF397 domain-containing protein [Actinophytocola sp.]|uniref:DUF397 domain-containing protein n=1 Tax=Actinophytocola sp. TaxID=1872138 RepID=UPI002DBBA41E|nr:DUF397 domain-containing protein [Actinophytocola sp.]HEU5469986.1 DUF397 domain-containing protein [Actinophytocola sp.]